MSEVTTRFKTPRVRSRRHLDRLKTLRCSFPLCRRGPVDPHHLTCSPQPKARGLTAGDDWAVPLCRVHHDAAYPRSVHSTGREADWWAQLGIDPIALAEHHAAVSRAMGLLPP